MGRSLVCHFIAVFSGPQFSRWVLHVFIFDKLIKMCCRYLTFKSSCHCTPWIHNPLKTINMLMSNVQSDLMELNSLRPVWRSRIRYWWIGPPQWWRAGVIAPSCGVMVLMRVCQWVRGCNRSGDGSDLAGLRWLYWVCVSVALRFSRL